jgi:UDPglucose 6-dehydrogenase
MAENIILMKSVKKFQMKICIIGTGYVGLTEGVCFAEIGHDVICYDVVKEKIEKLQQGIPTLYENGLKEILNKNLENKKIQFTTDLNIAIKDADAVFLCVPTPEKDDGSADLSYILQASENIAKIKNINKEFVLIIKSTVPIGTNKLVEKKVKDTNKELKFTMASNPEFSRQGFAIQDFLEPDRIVVGVNDAKTENIIKQIYKPITDNAHPLFLTNIETAEMIKYASNGFLAMKIAFINEIADICEKTGANVEDVAKIMGKDKRISPLFLKCGPGVGGSCFPKDSAALANISKTLNLENDLIKASVSTSKKRIKLMANKILNVTDLKNKTISILGLTFKANTDDLRCSPSLDIIKELIKNDVKINGYDPQVKKDLENVKVFDNPYKAIENTELVVILTEWDEFKKLDYKKIYEIVKNKIIIDLRNILDSNIIKKIGFKYICIGKQ